MYKKINLSVSSVLAVGMIFVGFSQQQLNAETSQQANGVVVDGYGNPVKYGSGGIVRDGYASTSSAGSTIDSQNAPDVQYAPDRQTASVVTPSGIDHQVQDVVVPKSKPYYKPKPHHHKVRPTQKRHHMAKPVQRMAKPVQRRSVAYTGYRSGMPPAKPNQCYAKVRTGPTFKNVVKRVQVSPAVNKRVLVRGPQYGYTSKRVQVRPASHTYRYVPAQYRNVSKRVLVKPAHYTWQKGKRGPVTRIDNMTGEILCRVKIPATYRNVVRKVLVRPAQRIKRNIPAVYRTVKQKRLTSPAQYRNVRKPARFVNKTYRIKSGGGGYKWQAINC